MCCSQTIASKHAWCKEGGWWLGKEIEQDGNHNLVRALQYVVLFWLLAIFILLVVTGLQISDSTATCEVTTCVCLIGKVLLCLCMVVVRGQTLKNQNQFKRAKHLLSLLLPTTTRHDTTRHDTIVVHHDGSSQELGRWHVWTRRNGSDPHSP